MGRVCRRRLRDDGIEAELQDTRDLFLRLIDNCGKELLNLLGLLGNKHGIRGAVVSVQRTSSSLPGLGLRISVLKTRESFGVVMMLNLRCESVRLDSGV